MFLKDMWVKYFRALPGASNVRDKYKTPIASRINPWFQGEVFYAAG